MVLDYSRWLQSLRDVAARLAARGIAPQLTINPPMAEEEIARDEGYFARMTGDPQFRYHPSLRALYTTTGGVRFYWQTQDVAGFQPTFGSMRLLPLLLLYESELGNQPGESWHGVWRVLDEVGTSTQTMIQFDPHGTASLAYCSVEGDAKTLTPLSLGVDEYLELALATCCRHHWQLLFAADPTVLAQDHVDEIFADLEDLSPPADPGAVWRRRRA